MRNPSAGLYVDQGLITRSDIDRKTFRNWAEFERAIAVEQFRERSRKIVDDQALELRWNAALGNFDGAAFGGANDEAVEAIFVGTGLRPQQLMDRFIEPLHPRGNAGIGIEGSEPVVEQERRRRPDAHQRGHAVEAASAARHLELPAFPVGGILHGDPAHLRKSL